MTSQPSTSENGRPATLDDLPAADWTSTTRLPYGVARVRTRPAGDTFMVNVRGAGPPWAGSWGEVAADGVYRLPTGTGYAFIATCEGPETTVQVQNYQAHGVMAVHAFYHFTDDSGRRDFYTREFYVTGGEPRPATGGGLPEALLSGGNDSYGGNDLSGVLGSWTVLAPEICQIEELVVRLENGRPTVRARGKDGDWGTEPAALYADAALPQGPPAFLATYELGDRRVVVQARDFLGVLVVAEYTTYTDGSGRADHYVRDCFKR